MHEYYRRHICEGLPFLAKLILRHYSKQVQLLGVEIFAQAEGQNHWLVLNCGIV